jgi:hypothetical protein
VSTNYQSTKEVPLDAIIARLRELSGAIIRGREAQASEFTMRIPAECDRDADLVLSEAANRLNAMQARVAEMESVIKNAMEEETEFDTEWDLAARKSLAGGDKGWLLRQKADVIEQCMRDIHSLRSAFNLSEDETMGIKMAVQHCKGEVKDLRLAADKVEVKGFRQAADEADTAGGGL